MEIKKHPLKPAVRPVTGKDPDDHIFLTIQIGNGQIGGSKVSLDGETLAKGSLTQPALLGPAGKFLNKEIQIETNVLDVNAFTNMCVITTTFLNQENQVLFTKIDSGEAPENGIASFKGKYKITLLTWLLLLFAWCRPGTVWAQSSGGELDFPGLETPSSPGFILLDKAPAAIERPTTPQGFGVGVLGLLRGSGGAMEVAPFWLALHPNLTAEKMYKNPVPVLYNFSLSAATVKSDSTSYLAGGIRTRLFQSYPQKALDQLDSVRKEIENALADVDSLGNLDLDKIEALRQVYAGLIEKPVFTIDLAGALGGGSGNNSFNNLNFNRWAAWLSLNWRPKGNEFYVTALSRYIRNEAFETYAAETNLLDVGARLNYDIARFSLSAEYLQRFDLLESSGSDYRIAAIGSYAFSENIYLTATFGKNFSEVNNIIATAGINFGFSRSKVKAF